MWTEQYIPLERVSAYSPYLSLQGTVRQVARTLCHPTLIDKAQRYQARTQGYTGLSIASYLAAAGVFWREKCWDFEQTFGHKCLACTLKHAGS